MSRADDVAMHLPDAVDELRQLFGQAVIDKHASPAIAAMCREHVQADNNNNLPHEHVNLAQSSTWTTESRDRATDACNWFDGLVEAAQWFGASFLTKHHFPWSRVELAHASQAVAAAGAISSRPAPGLQCTPSEATELEGAEAMDVYEGASALAAAAGSDASESGATAAAEADRDGAGNSTGDGVLRTVIRTVGDFKVFICTAAAVAEAQKDVTGRNWGSKQYLQLGQVCFQLPFRGRDKRIACNMLSAMINVQRCLVGSI
jgi:hypothetical protein